MKAMLKSLTAIRTWTAAFAAVLLCNGALGESFTEVHWTGEAGDGNLANPDNWAERTVPDADTTVCFSGTAVPDIKSGATFAAKALTVDVMLAADCDWSGLDASIPVSGKIDLASHKFTVSSSSLTGDCEISDSLTETYERLEYIQSSGAQSQYIDTGYVHASNTKIECVVDVASEQPNNWAAIFGSRKVGHGSHAYCFFAKDDKGYVRYNRTGNEGNNNSLFPRDQKVSLTCEGATSVWTGGSLTTSGTCDAGFNTMFVFNLNTSGSEDGKAPDGSGIVMKLYEFRISEDGAVKRDFVPVRRVSDGKVGLLDLANLGAGNEFYVNAGGADFTAGSVVLGELHLSCASESEMGDVKFSGQFRLVKEGPGALTIAKERLTHAGGLVVKAGEIRFGGNSIPSGSDVVLDGGTLGVADPDAAIDILGSLTLTDGTLAAKGFNVGAGGLFVQTGGELKVGSLGLTASSAGSVAEPHFVFQGGTLTATADFSVGSDVSAAFGDALSVLDPRIADTNAFTVDLNGHDVDWSTALVGSSALTITGDGAFVSVAGPHPYPMRAVTIATEPTAEVHISSIYGFLQGLTLEKGAVATVELVSSYADRVRLEGKGKDLNHWLSADNVYDSTISNFDEMNKKIIETPLVDPTYISYRGQFYVPADKAGEWYFIGAYDDVSYLEIDGTQVGNIKLDNNWTTVNTGSRELTAGWHDFRLFFGQHSGGWGPLDALKNSKGKYAFGWTTDASAKDSTDGTKYESFDPTTLVMRGTIKRSLAESPALDVVPGVRWQHDNRDCGIGTLVDWMEPTTSYDGVDWIQSTVKDLLCSTSNQQLGRRRNRLSGYVYIPTTGEWKVKGKFDDKFCMRLDGEIVVSYASHDKEFSNDSLQLTAGWHFFDIQIADTAGGYGANYRDSNNQQCSVAFCAPGSDKYLAFTEDNFALRAADPGLSGTVTLAEGSTLKGGLSANCPIRGVLEGSGKFADNFTFEDVTWRVKVGAKALTEVLDVADVANGGFLRSLRKIEVVLAEPARLSRYPLCDAGDLTDAEVAQIEVTAVAAEGSNVDVRPSDTWRLTVANGKLCLVNPRPVGLTILIY